MLGRYGEVRCPSHRPHYKKRSNTQVKEKFCDKLIGFVDLNNEPHCNIMYCSSCKTFTKVENVGGVITLEVLKEKIPTEQIIGTVNEHA